MSRESFGGKFGEPQEEQEKNAEGQGEKEAEKPEEKKTDEQLIAEGGYGNYLEKRDEAYDAWEMKRRAKELLDSVYDAEGNLVNAQELKLTENVKDVLRAYGFKDDEIEFVPVGRLFKGLRARYEVGEALKKVGFGARPAEEQRPESSPTETNLPAVRLRAERENNQGKGEAEIWEETRGKLEGAEGVEVRAWIEKEQKRTDARDGAKEAETEKKFKEAIEEPEVTGGREIGKKEKRAWEKEKRIYEEKKQAREEVRAWMEKEAVGAWVEQERARLRAKGFEGERFEKRLRASVFKKFESVHAEALKAYEASLPPRERNIFTKLFRQWKDLSAAPRAAVAVAAIVGMPTALAGALGAGGAALGAGLIGGLFLRKWTLRFVVMLGSEFAKVLGFKGWDDVVKKMKEKKKSEGKKEEKK